MQRVIAIGSPREARVLFGAQDRHLRRIRDAFEVKIVARETYLRVEGEDASVTLATRALQNLLAVARGGRGIQEEDVDSAIGAASAAADRRDSLIDVMRGQRVAARTPGQQRYVDAIKRNDLVFCIGPAGTGKTYLAVAMAVSALRKQIVQRIVLARPAVEAGEKLGFLPGDIEAKVNPYLRPLYDALREMMPPSLMSKYVQNDLIEIVPLAYMRGRTLDDAFIILDEAQNCTIKQMKTFLTRLGQRSKIVVTGDVTQIDLERDEDSGLVDVRGILADVPGVAFVTLDVEDIVRHPLVQDIVDAYDARGRARSAPRGACGPAEHSEGEAPGEPDNSP